MQEVKIASSPFLLVRIPSLRIHTSSSPAVFEANLKTETELWNLMVKEMWVGRKMADQHKVQTHVSIELDSRCSMAPIRSSDNGSHDTYRNFFFNLSFREPLDDNDHSKNGTLCF